MAETFAYDVFLSHSSRDKDVVRELAQRLKAAGLRVWFDEWDIKPGNMIGLQIEKALEQSRVLVLAMTDNAFGSDWVSLERQTVLFRDPTNANRRFIPILLGDVKIPDTLHQFAYVDWRDRSDDQFERLLSACQTSQYCLRKAATTKDKDGPAAPLDASRAEGATLHRRAIRYSPALIKEWKTSLTNGYWSEVLDCRDETLLHDLVSLVGQVFADRSVPKSCISNSQVAIMELCRNVSQHATKPSALVEVAIDHEVGRLVVEVTSQGSPFSLEKALAKYESSEQRPCLHGFQNLLTNGVLHVSHLAGNNTVRFDCILPPPTDDHATTLVISLSFSSVQIGANHYQYAQWLNVIGIPDRHGSPFVRPDKGLIERTKTALVEAYNGCNPIQVQVLADPPKWSLSRTEISVIRCFSVLVSDISKDERFVISEVRTTIERQTPSLSLRHLKETLEKALEESQVRRSARGTKGFD